MAEQKVNSDNNDDDDVFKNPDDLDLETVRRVKEALEHQLKSFYNRRLDNTAARQQKQIIKYAWRWAMRVLFTDLFSNPADRWDLVKQFTMEEEDDRFNIGVFCHTCPLEDRCEDICRYFGGVRDDNYYLYTNYEEMDDYDYDNNLSGWLNEKSKEIDSLDDNGTDNRADEKTVSDNDTTEEKLKDW